MGNEKELETISVTVKKVEKGTMEAMELTDNELEAVTGGVYIPGSEVRINQSNQAHWTAYFNNGNTVIYRGQHWRVSWYEYRDGRFYNFDLYNPYTYEVVNYVPASDVSVNVNR